MIFFAPGRQGRLFLPNAVFTYIVDFGKIPGRIFPLYTKGFNLEKLQAALFFPSHRGFLR
ncbi:hypothetical protein D3H55_01815 [Bacillus salacetis]|uniref:Uncharacterized protein n=1 Tax=Bacillus salacetis TaxID=2315464 RepID=A0A3A1RBJ2_9BACI|nr:hypothetical protein D3H55_01815 [Bacillus salacetis]